MPFLVLTSKRLICVLARSNASVKVTLDLEILKLQKLSVAPLSGIFLKKEDIEMRLYFVQEKAGQEFSNSLKSLDINVEYIPTLPADKHEKVLLFQGIIGFIMAAALFGSCVYRSATDTESVNTNVGSEAIEACLRRYIKGDTVEAHEIEEAYSRCAP